MNWMRIEEFAGVALFGSNDGYKSVIELTDFALSTWRYHKKKHESAKQAARKSVSKN